MKAHTTIITIGLTLALAGTLWAGQPEPTCPFGREPDPCAICQAWPAEPNRQR